MLTDIIAYALILYLVGGVLAFVIMLYRCRKTWRANGCHVSIDDMVMVAFLVSWFYVCDVVQHLIENYIKKHKK